MIAKIIIIMMIKIIVIFFSSSKETKYSFYTFLWIKKHKN